MRYHVNNATEFCSFFAEDLLVDLVKRRAYYDVKYIIYHM